MYSLNASRKLQFGGDPPQRDQSRAGSALAREVSIIRSNLTNRLASGNFNLSSPGASHMPQMERAQQDLHYMAHNSLDETNNVSMLRNMLAKVKMDRARLEHMLVRTEMQKLGENAAAETKHDREAHAVVEDLCEQLLHERLQRLRCLEVVRDLSCSLATGDAENTQAGEWHEAGKWDQALGRARCTLQDACDEWDAARGAGDDEKREGPWDPGTGQRAGRGLRRGEDATFAQCLEDEVESEARHAKLVQVCCPFLQNQGRARCFHICTCLMGNNDFDMSRTFFSGTFLGESALARGAAPQR